MQVCETTPQPLVFTLVWQGLSLCHLECGLSQSPIRLAVSCHGCSDTRGNVRVPCIVRRAVQLRDEIWALCAQEPCSTAEAVIVIAVDKLENLCKITASTLDLVWV